MFFFYEQMIYLVNIFLKILFFKKIISIYNVYNGMDRYDNEKILKFRYLLI